MGRNVGCRKKIKTKQPERYGKKRGEQKKRTRAWEKP